MKFKGVFIILLITLSLMLCVSAVSAEESASDGNSTGEILKVDSSEPVLASSAASSNSTSSAPVSQPVQPVRTDVEADDVSVVYKKKGYFKVKVEDDSNDRPVKKLKLKIKVFTKSKSKTYIIKTNSRGIAKFNTKGLKVGTHKVVVTSTDEKYPVNIDAKIFVGKKKTVTLKAKAKKKLKNKDTIRVYTRHDGEDKELKVAFKGKAKNTRILKAVFYFKHKYTGETIKMVDRAEFDDGVWELPEVEYSYRLTPVKVKVSYVTFK